MRRLIFVFTLLALAAVSTFAQNSITTAKPEENARMKPLIAAENKAREALTAKLATLPESKAYNEAKQALDKAAEALNKAADSLPESSALKLAAAAAWDEAFRILAAHQLSSREYKPELDAKGDLIFTKLPPKQ